MKFQTLDLNLCAAKSKALEIKIVGEGTKEDQMADGLKRNVPSPEISAYYKEVFRANACCIPYG
jgi:hypothetical protein